MKKKKKTKHSRSTYSDFKIRSQVTRIKTMSWQKDRRTDHWNRVYVLLNNFFTKMPKQFKGKRKVASTNNVGTTGILNG